jgi:hypothetical protein
MLLTRVLAIDYISIAVDITNIKQSVTCFISVSLLTLLVYKQINIYNYDRQHKTPTVGKAII